MTVLPNYVANSGAARRPPRLWGAQHPEVRSGEAEHCTPADGVFEMLSDFRPGPAGGRTHRRIASAQIELSTAAQPERSASSVSRFATSCFNVPVSLSAPAVS